jgi:hypothetical protein
MFINATKGQISAMGVPLERGEYAVIENNIAKKGVSNLIPDAGESSSDQQKIDNGVKTEKELSLNSIPRGKSVVHFYRPTNMMTSLLSPSIYDNDQEILNGLKNGGCWDYFIDPGEHIFSNSSRTTIGSAVTIDSKSASEEFYIRMDILMKAFVGETKLTKVYPDQGRKEMTGCTLVK